MKEKRFLSSNSKGVYFIIIARSSCFTRQLCIINIAFHIIVDPFVRSSIALECFGLTFVVCSLIWPYYPLLAKKIFFFLHSFCACVYIFIPYLNIFFFFLFENVFEFLFFFLWASFPFLELQRFLIFFLLQTFFERASISL